MFRTARWPMRTTVQSLKLPNSEFNSSVWPVLPWEPRGHQQTHRSSGLRDGAGPRPLGRIGTNRGNSRRLRPMRARAGTAAHCFVSQVRDNIDFMRVLRVLSFCCITVSLFGVATGQEKSEAKLPSFVRSAWPGQVNTLPRPNSGAMDVPVDTTLYFELASGSDEAGKPDPADLAALRVTLTRADANESTLLYGDGHWCNGTSGRIFEPQEFPQQPNTGVYIVPPRLLAPATTYAVSVAGGVGAGPGRVSRLTGLDGDSRPAPRLRPAPRPSRTMSPSR